ncbi:SDR family mycofactocin-dependent oxidoreductase [Kribbella sp. VKM Ac-2527]|uniref:SDR family mycofactocin-dependent oxidoreductase n=1 Tax=Kribbella caucasensis TaxID=2512215 RepID=A0A4R6KNU5_9ACTN|nr:mycofactocin-coupled SDR family oxidoreductase [Kribbella sp. VKM Ac-2527]TDO51790.1 SDR family mycofactocin-dependent oxidoreductase [Kribbella sp. VKM Ac-2527]
MRRVENKVAFITGAARGQGRNHALRLAEEGADIIAVDMCKQLPSARYDLATSEDLADTRKAIEALGRKVLTVEADVRDEQQLADAFREGVATIGLVDIVVANAGVALFAVDQPHEAWQDTIDINLTGVFNTLETVVPSMVERGQGGAIVLTSSTAGLRGILGPSRGALAYVASKHGLVGLMRSYANNLAAHSIRVNSVHPTGVETPMIVTPSIDAFLEANPELVPHITNAMPVGLVSVQDVSNAVLYLVSDEGRYVTGTTLSVDAGFANKI